MARKLPARALPERDELKDLLRLLALSKISVGVAEGVTGGVLRQEDEDAGLTATSGRDVVALDGVVLAVVRDGMEVEIEGLPCKQVLAPGAAEPFMPCGEDLRRLRVADARGVLGQVALLRGRVEPREQRQSLVGDQGHDVALSLDRPELERQRRPQGMRRRDHLGAGQLGGLGNPVEAQAYEFRHEEEQPRTAARKGAWRQGEVADVGNRLLARPRSLRTLLIQSTR